MSPSPTQQLYKRKKSGGSENGEDPPIQLYRPANSNHDVQRLLSRLDWTSGPTNGKELDNELLDRFLAGRLSPEEDPIDDRQQMRQALHRRQAELRELAEQWKRGEARMDEDGRLIAITEPPQPPRANLPPPPPPGEQDNPDNPQLEMEQDFRVEQWQREAAEAIARAVERYRSQGVPEEEFEVILIEPHEGAAPNLTFRRICIAVLAVITAFVCVILQTLPLLQPSETMDPSFDDVMYELLHVRFLKTHVRFCPGLHRQGSGDWKDQLRQDLGFTSEKDCNDGVLHIPAPSVVRNNLKHSTRAEAALILPYRDGFNVSWTVPCHTPPQDGAISKCYPGWRSDTNSIDVSTNTTGECANPNHASRCFRGVHDDIITKEEVDEALDLGAYYIRRGGDHFDVHYDVDHLKQSLPDIIDKLRRLLMENYQLEHIEPVAFRVHSAGPMEDHAINVDKSLAQTLNQDNYREWLRACKTQNKLARYSLPWPFRVPPVRDTCNLIADLEADPRFAIHTSISLSEGAGARNGYWGGATLYMDNHPSNSQPKHKVKRGVTIDGTIGRVVVSTGGIENRRCRFPTRAGLRTVLQIWWDC